MRTVRNVLIAAVALGCLSTSVNADTRISDKLKMYKLDNGMHVFVYPRKEAPVFCGMIYVNAGSAEENASETGIAHLLEHMAFKGTPWVGTKDWAKERPILIEIENTAEELAAETAKNESDRDHDKIKGLEKQLTDLQEQAAQFTKPNEYDNIITRAGGTAVNASTSADTTNYYMTLPANQLELWAMMESERLVYPAWREFYKERDVVAEERRMRYDDSPDGKVYESFLSTSFTAHPYRNPVIGWMSDIQNLTVRTTDAFYRRWYVPENFTAVVVGDVDPDEVHSVMKRYFGSLPAVKSPAKNITEEPRQQGERRTTVTFDAQPQMMVGWHKPTFPDPDTYVIEVIQFVMTRNGRSSRLYERLVKKDGICQSVESFTAPGDKYPNLYAVQLNPRAPHTTAEAERALYEEIERLKREPISEQELEKTRNQIDATFVQDLESNNDFAKRLGWYFTVTKDPEILDKLRENMKAVTPQDIMRVAQKYFTKDNRNVVELVTAERATPAAAPKEATEIKAEAPAPKEAPAQDAPAPAGEAAAPADDATSPSANDSSTSAPAENQDNDQ